MIMCVVYTNLSVTPFFMVIILNVLMMMGVLSRMVPSQALMSAVPDMADRGSFMSINASVQQIAGGIAAVAGGLIITKKTDYSPLEHYNIVGYVVVAVSICSIMLLSRVSKMVDRKMKDKAPVVQKEEVVVSEGL